MRIFGIDAARLAALVDEVWPTATADTGASDACPDVPGGAARHGAPCQESGAGGAGEDAPADRFARGAWSTLVEPGDGDAGALVAALGAPDALTALVEDWPASRILAAVSERGGSTAERLGSSLPDALARWRPRLRMADTMHAFELAARVGARLLIPADAAWPAGVDDLGAHAPLSLWLRGTIEACESLQRSVAIVGARAATGYGEHVAMEAGAGLVDRGFAIVSGAAYGIDGTAHRTALASRGSTAAFLAGGVDRFYPSGHDALLGRIAQSGAVLSELPCGSAPTKWRFLQRNRLIAAASQATMVLEAGWRSGSLNTAGHAAALGRPVGAVPGPVTSPASAGCHRLIRDYAAVCVTNAAEMAELVDGLAEPVSAREAAGRSPEQTRVLDALSGRAARALGDVAWRCGMSPASVGSVLGVLQLEGVVAEREHGWVRATR